MDEDRTRKRSRKVHIGVFTALGSDYGQEIAAGVQRFGRANKRWRFCTVGDIGKFLKSDWRQFELDGVIGQFPEVPPALLEDIPAVVNVSREPLGRGEVQNVLSDHEACGRMTAEFFQRRTAAEILILGRTPSTIPEAFRAGLEAVVETERPAIPLSLSCEAQTARTQTGFKERLGAALAKLPAGAAVVTLDDALAESVLAVCHEKGIAIPRSLSLLSLEEGAGGGRWPLSFIDLDPGRIGYEAAQRIDAMTRAGFAPPAGGFETVRVPPNDIIERSTTRPESAGDELVVRVAAFIRQEAVRGLGVAELVGKFGIPRRTLERRFRRARNTSIHQEILLRQVVEARRLLEQSSLPIATVAFQSGFSEPRLLNIAIKKHTGLTPTAYREKCSGRRAPESIKSQGD